MNEQELAKLVNRSGFLFQWAVEEHVRGTSSEHGWEVVAREYPWSSPDNTRGGFIDFVADRYGLHGVFECKRSQAGEWIFLVPHDARPTLQMRTLWSFVTNSGTTELGWADLHYNPAMLRSEFCIVRGASDEDKPMLERVAGDLVRASESLARDEGDTSRHTRDTPAGFIPIVVTNTNLYVCRIEPRQVDLTTGTLPTSAVFEPVSAIKFQKATATDVKRPVSGHRTIRERLLSKERSVVVVNVVHLVEWLKNVSEEASGLSDPPRPWAHLLQ